MYMYVHTCTCTCTTAVITVTGFHTEEGTALDSPPQSSILGSVVCFYYVVVNLSCPCDPINWDSVQNKLTCVLFILPQLNQRPFRVRLWWEGLPSLLLTHIISLFRLTFLDHHNRCKPKDRCMLALYMCMQHVLNTYCTDFQLHTGLYMYNVCLISSIFQLESTN